MVARHLRRSSLIRAGHHKPSKKLILRCVPYPRQACVESTPPKKLLIDMIGVHEGMRAVEEHHVESDSHCPDIEGKGITISLRQDINFGWPKGGRAPFHKKGLVVVEQAGASKVRDLASLFILQKHVCRLNVSVKNMSRL